MLPSLISWDGKKIRLWRTKDKQWTVYKSPRDQNTSLECPWLLLLQDKTMDFQKSMRILISENNSSPTPEQLHRLTSHTPSEVPVTLLFPRHLLMGPARVRTPQLLDPSLCPLLPLHFINMKPQTRAKHHTPPPPPIITAMQRPGHYLINC